MSPFKGSYFFSDGFVWAKNPSVMLTFAMDIHPSINFCYKLIFKNSVGRSSIMFVTAQSVRNFCQKYQHFRQKYIYWKIPLTMLMVLTNLDSFVIFGWKWALFCIDYIPFFRFYSLFTTNMTLFEDLDFYDVIIS